MLAVASLLFVLLLSLVVVRIATVALTLTGLWRAVARFQARSAWTGTGFTTQESETLMSHPVRRQIISLLMLLRGAGLVTAASTLMLSFVTVASREQGFVRLGILFGGAVLIWLIARSRLIDIWMSHVIAAALKRYTKIDTRDYAGLLHLAGEYAIMEHWRCRTATGWRRNGWSNSGCPTRESSCSASPSPTAAMSVRRAAPPHSSRKTS
ncbi:MAG: hypothetical protein P8Y53_02410 [Pseudolabrys sp.]